MTKTKCLYCKKDFWVKSSEIKRGGGKYCSVKCSDLAHTKRIKLFCQTCNKPIEIQPSNICKKNYCSRKCAYIGKRNKLKKFCQICQKIFFVIPARINAKYCSEKCRYISQKGKPPWNKGKPHPKVAGSKNPHWKGGICKDPRGYILFKSSNHSYKTKNGYVYKHRLIMEKHIGRYLLPSERVHHINGIKSDNRFENLKLFSNEGEHQKFHFTHRSSPSL